jgi:hypothetical protein
VGVLSSIEIREESYSLEADPSPSRGKDNRGGGSRGRLDALVQFERSKEETGSNDLLLIQGVQERITRLVGRDSPQASKIEVDEGPAQFM